jgi:hypothetical protein
MSVSENGVLRIFNGKSRESQKAGSDCIMRNFVTIYCQADPSGRAVLGVGLRPLSCWACGFQSRQEYRCLSVVSDVFCQVEVYASG